MRPVHQFGRVGWQCADTCRYRRRIESVIDPLVRMSRTHPLAERTLDRSCLFPGAPVLPRVAVARTLAQDSAGRLEPAGNLSAVGLGHYALLDCDRPYRCRESHATLLPHPDLEHASCACGSGGSDHTFVHTGHGLSICRHADNLRTWGKRSAAAQCR